MDTYLKVTDTFQVNNSYVNEESKRKHIERYVQKILQKGKNTTVDFIKEMSDNWMICGWLRWI